MDAGRDGRRTGPASPPPMGAWGRRGWGRRRARGAASWEGVVMVSGLRGGCRVVGGTSSVSGGEAGRRYHRTGMVAVEAPRPVSEPVIHGDGETRSVAVEGGGDRQEPNAATGADGNKIGPVLRKNPEISWGMTLLSQVATALDKIEKEKALPPKKRKSSMLAYADVYSDEDGSEGEEGSPMEVTGGNIAEEGDVDKEEGANNPADKGEQRGGGKAGGEDNLESGEEREEDEEDLEDNEDDLESNEEDDEDYFEEEEEEEEEYVEEEEEEEKEEEWSGKGGDIEEDGVGNGAVDAMVRNEVQAVQAGGGDVTPPRNLSPSRNPTVNSEKGESGVLNDVGSAARAAAAANEEQQEEDLYTVVKLRQAPSLAGRFCNFLLGNGRTCSLATRPGHVFCREHGPRKPRKMRRSSRSTRPPSLLMHAGNVSVRGVDYDSCSGEEVEGPRPRAAVAVAVRRRRRKKFRSLGSIYRATKVAVRPLSDES